MRIVGIDTGYSAAPCGLALVETDLLTMQASQALLWSAAVKSQGAREWQRIQNAIANVAAALQDQQFSALAFELPYYSKDHPNAQTLSGLAQVCGGLIRIAQEHGVPAIGVYPLEAKQALTGDGHAQKDQMISACQQLFGVRLSSHEADAVGIALSGEAKLRTRQLEEQQRVIQSTQRRFKLG